MIRSLKSLSIGAVEFSPKEGNMLKKNAPKSIKLYKYCDPKFNPFNGSKTLLLNSTKVFRKNYKGGGDLINDCKEGLVTVWEQGRNITLKDCKNHPDAFIYCTSTRKLDLKEVINRFGASYTSCYCIKNSDSFMHALSYHVMKAIYDNFYNIFPEKIYEYIDDMMKGSEQKHFHLDVFPVHDIVRYEKGSLIKIHDFRDVLGLSMISHLTKPPEYATQCEYRMLFFPGFLPQDWYFDILETGLLVEFDNILEFIEPC